MTELHATKSPDEWGEQLYPASGRTRWRHDLAAIGHGWALHTHEAGKPMQLSRADYHAAIEAAANNAVHPPALSAYAPIAKAAKRAAAAAKASANTASQGNSVASDSVQEGSST